MTKPGSGPGVIGVAYGGIGEDAGDAVAAGVLDADVAADACYGSACAASRR
jgi:hypothetical protein